MDKILKTSVIISAIVGFAAGLLLLINFLFLTLLVKFAVVFFLFVLLGSGIIIYLKKNSLVGILTIQNAALIGAVSGFVSFSAAAIVFMPINYIIELLTNHYRHSFVFNDFSYTLIISTVLVFFIALVISAPFNAISSMLAAYIYEKIENKPFEFHTNFEIEVDQDDLK